MSLQRYEVLINIVTILMILGKMATPGLRKIKEKKGYDVIISVNESVPLVITLVISPK